MAISKNIFYFSIFIFIFVSFTQFIHAQNIQESTYRVVKTEEGYSISQTIYFPATPDVIRYHVTIEKIEDGLTTIVEQIETVQNKVDVFLKAGLYRYQYTAVNRMNVTEGISEWQVFTVLAGLEPVIDNFQPFYAMYLDMHDNERKLTIHGKDFFPDSEYALVKGRNNYNWIGVSLHGRSDVIIPNRVEVFENRAVLYFTKNAIRELGINSGVYSLFIRNPGGLWNEFGEINIGYHRQLDIIFSFGYSPVIAAFDVSKTFYNDEVGNQLDVFNPIGYNMSIGLIPIKSASGNFGFELNGSFIVDNLIQYEINNNSAYYHFFKPFSSMNFNLLYQYPMTPRWQHNIKLGLGYNIDYYNNNLYFYDEEDNYDYSVQYYEIVIPLSINLGYSIQYFVWKNLFLQAGLDAKFIFSSNPSVTYNYLMLIPFINIGWQFGKWTENAEVSEWAARGVDISLPVTEMPRREPLSSVSWFPSIPISGFNNEIKSFYPLGIKFKFANMSYYWGKNRLGFGFEHGLLERSDEDDDEEILELFNVIRKTNLLNHVFLNCYYQYVLFESFKLGANIGFGITCNYDYDDIGFAMNLGLSAQYFIGAAFFIEAALDMQFTFASETKYTLRPGIALGVQANRNNKKGIQPRGLGFQLLPQKEKPKEAEGNNDTPLY